jgi:hypothetical protein
MPDRIARPLFRRVGTAGLALALLLVPALAFSGKGGPPGITPTPFFFGSVTVGGSSPSQTFTLDNTSAETLTITSAVLGGSAPSQFAVDGNDCAGAVLVAGADCSLVVRFTPGAPGNQVALVRVQYTSPGAPGGVDANATISGNGLPVPAVAVPAPAVGTLALALGALLILFGAWMRSRSV